MHLLFFLLFQWILFAFYCFFFLYENAALWLAGCSLPACLWTACLPWACPRCHCLCVCVCCVFFLILLFCFFLSCLPARLSLFTLVMSKLLPLNRLQCRNPRRRGSQQGAQKLIHVRAISLMNQIRHDNTYSQVNKHTLRGCNTYTHF